MIAPQPATTPGRGVLTVSGLRASYNGVAALHGVELEARPGAVTCVMGRNGVGKTTLLRTIMGTHRRDAGVVALDGADIGALPAHRRARRGIALVPQGREIFPRLTVEENLRIGLEARATRVRAIPDEVFALFPILKSFLRRLGGDLSGGQQQQLAIARALVGDPQVLLLDEPTEGIQPNVIAEIGAVLQRLARERGMTVVLVEQYLDFVRTVGDRFAIMDRGRVVAAGATAELDAGLVGRHLSV